MSDEGEEFEQPEDDFSGSEGGGEGGGGGGLCTACICMLIGLALYPGALGLSGYNEKRAVCRQKALYAAEDKSILLSCSAPAAESGEPVEPGNLGFLSCELDETTLSTYSKDDIPGLEAMSPNLFREAGLGLSVQTEMVICKEKCIREACRHRRLSGQGRDDKETDDGEHESFTQAGDRKVESFPEASFVTSTESEPSNVPVRRLGSRRRTQSSCTKECVEWGYQLEWSSTPGSPEGVFKDPVKAQQNCGGTNPQEGLFRPAMKIPTKYADSGQVHVQGGGWKLNENQTKAIPIDKPVQMSDEEGMVQSLQQPPLSWSDANTMVRGNQLHTCNTAQSGTPQLGCMRLSAWVSRPDRVALLGEISQTQTPGVMKEEDWEAPADWLCSGQTVQRVCPSAKVPAVRADTFMQGGGIAFESCGEIRTMEELFEVMHSENNMMTWIYRLAGFLLTWLGICCICQPISACVKMSTDFLDQITECIPGVGCIVDEMTDMLTGLVNSVICAVSCLCGFSSFAFVAAVMWVVMRPMVGIPLLILGVGLCAGAGFVMHTCRKKGSRNEGPQQELLPENSS
mmetsp:Transcript_11410/g.22016  ORF Transcript_11410/g.22016 Transcript_11410/m.22016 type:complete len:570 (-) Transcript_11410:164-1873(-)